MYDKPDLIQYRQKKDTSVAAHYIHDEFIYFCHDWCKQDNRRGEGCNKVHERSEQGLETGTESKAVTIFSLS